MTGDRAVTPDAPATRGTPSTSGPLPIAVLLWADGLVEQLAGEPLFQHTSVFVGAPDRDHLILAALRWGLMRDTGEVLPGSRIAPVHGSVCGRVFRSGKPALIVDVRADAEYLASPGGPCRSELAVPIAAAGRVVGVVNLESPHIGGFTIADLGRVELLADLAGAAFAAGDLSDLLRPRPNP
jgi:GAF domain-containing protein